MLSRLRLVFAWQILAASLMVLSWSQMTLGQGGVVDPAPPVDPGTGTGDGTTDTIGGGLSSGVSVDADGVLRGLAEFDPTGRLAQQRAQQAFAQLDSDIRTPSKLRKVSLTRLARLVKSAIDEGHGPDEAMKHLAGLTRIQYVFYYPETQDIVIAGPAEGWVRVDTQSICGT